jgi:AMP deaminase
MDDDYDDVPRYDLEHEELDHDPDATPMESSQSVLPRDRQTASAYFDYASEKSLSHADAKLIYQRHQLESNISQDPSAHIKRAWTVPSNADTDKPLSRNESITSRPETSGSAYQAPVPLGSTNADKHFGAAIAQSPRPRHPENDLDLSTSQNADQYLAADQAARSHAIHPAVPHEPKPMLAEHGIHGAGAGIGVGTGAGGFASNDANVTSELSNIYTNIQKILDMRHKYIRLSLQQDGDNPKDDPSWPIYPPPPEPVWDEVNNRPFHSSSQQNSQTLNGDKPPATPISPARKRRKAGEEIGEDFEISECSLLDEGEMVFKLDENGIFQVYETPKSLELENPILGIPTIRDFYMDLDSILSISSDGPSKSFAFRRLQYLEGKYNLYFLLNEYQEMADSKKVPHRDFYNVRKVDTHVHHSACMNQKHLLRFIKSKMKKSPDEEVMYRDGKYLTLREVFESINLTAYDLSIDTLDMHVG